MTESEARALQELAYTTHPFLHIVIRSLGNPAFPEYVCYAIQERYFLWNLGEWNDYRATHEERLHRYTQEAINTMLASKGKGHAKKKRASSPRGKITNTVG